LRWRWPADLAEATAARIARRQADDDRRTCPECPHYRPGRCSRHRAAGLLHPDLGPDLAALPQRCPGSSIVTMAAQASDPQTVQYDASSANGPASMPTYLGGPAAPCRPDVASAR
jgi:hypothetical protein